MENLQTKRKNPRRKVRIPVLCWETDEQKKSGRGKELITRDLSSDGIGFFSNKIYPLGTSLHIEIYLPGKQKPISTSIEVTRIEAALNKDEFIIGSTFVSILHEEKSQIAKALNSMNIYLLLESVLQQGASDLHLTVGRPPMIRRDGRILPLAGELLEPGQVEAMIYPLITNYQIEFFEKNKELDFAFSPSLDSRFRVNLHWQKGFVEAALRNIPTKIQSFESLGLPIDMIKRFCNEKSGLVLIAGTTGSGKTTTMSAMVDYINTFKESVVITIEDPVEFTFKSRKSIIKQRELGSDTISYSEALKRVLHQDPDIICIGELLDSECLLAALRAAETGHLVITTIHAPSAAQAIERVINFLPPEHSLSIRQQLSTVLIGILFQALVSGKHGGQALATELLINNNAVSNLIREGKYSQIENILQTGRSLGMYPLKHNLNELIEKDIVDPEDAKALLRRIGNADFGIQ